MQKHNHSCRENHFTNRKKIIFFSLLIIKKETHIYFILEI